MSGNEQCFSVDQILEENDYKLGDHIASFAREIITQCVMFFNLF